jgi:hypothetical protein
VLERHLPIAVLGTFVHALLGKPAGADRWAAAAEQGSAAAAVPDGSTTGKLGPARTRAGPARPGAGMLDHQPQAPLPARPAPEPHPAGEEG